MLEYYNYRRSVESKIIPNRKPIQNPICLVGNNQKTLQFIQDQQIQLILSSPPYYNSKEYVFYKNYEDYLQQMKQTLQECYRVLENGRFIIIICSPVITKRPGREFESMRLPIPFDFHRILTEVGFYYVDDIIWQKQNPAVQDRNFSFRIHRKPLMYKPNTVTETILIYRKKNPFLIDQNIRKYPKNFGVFDITGIERTNIWKISPSKSKKHPAIFPKILCKNLIQCYSFPGDAILDMFAGSGTVGEVARELNRIPVLCEIFEYYIKQWKNLENYEILRES